MTIFLLFLAALLEGADIVSMGLAAPAVAKAYGFGPGDMAYILTAAIVGLMGGAAVGGRLGDLFGRKRVLLFAFFALAVFSLATAFATDLAQFITVRLLCGLGLGAAFPNLIALAAEASRPGEKSTGVGLMFAGQPIGGTLLALFIASQAGEFDWRIIFYIGGGLPLLLLPVLAFALPESKAFREAKAAVAGEAEAVRRPPVAFALFGEGRGPVSLLLWISYAFTQVIIYLLNNWLPTLMVAKGFTLQQAGLISAFENIGAAAGCVLLGLYADRGHLRTVIGVGYAVTALSLFALGAAEGFWVVAVVGIVVGFFVVGVQVVLYSVAPAYYPTLVRATGVGTAISFGRLGGIAGPLAAGKLLAIGLTPAAVLMAATPFAVVAGLAGLAVVFRPRPPEVE